MNPFGSAKELYKLKRKADEVKRQMEEITVEVEEKGIKIVMQGDNKVKEIWVDGELDTRIKGVFNSALKQAQKKVSKKMKNQLSDFGMPGF